MPLLRVPHIILIWEYKLRCYCAVSTKMLLRGAQCDGQNDIISVLLASYPPHRTYNGPDHTVRTVHITPSAPAAHSIPLMLYGSYRSGDFAVNT